MTRDRRRLLPAHAPARACERCSAVFSPAKASVGRFCSLRCAYQARTVTRAPIGCPSCGSAFTPTRAQAKGGGESFCSKSCRDAALQAPRNAAEPPAVVGARWVALTRGMFALVDEEDYARVSARPWTFGVGKGDAVSRGERLHRFIVSAATDVMIDHRSGDRLDNRRANLRAASASENVRNAVKRKRKGAASSRFKGVWWSVNGSNWQASIRAGKLRTWLGEFASEEAAARAYDDAARLRHGAFACLNFPRPGERSALTGLVEGEPVMITRSWRQP